MCRAISCQPLVHSEVLPSPRGLVAWRQAAQVEGQGTCRWEHQGGEGASWEACHQAEAQQWGGQASSGLALAALVPLGLSVLRGGGPLGGDPWEGNQDAWQRQVGVLHGGVEVPRGVVVALRGVVVVLQDACLVEGAQRVVRGVVLGADLDVALGALQGEVLGVVPGVVQAQVVAPGPVPEQQQLQPAAPSAAWPSSQRI